MADGAQLDHASERAEIRRALRVRRVRAEPTRTNTKRRRWGAWLIAALALATTAGAVAFFAVQPTLPNVASGPISDAAPAPPAARAHPPEAVLPSTPEPEAAPLDPQTLAATEAAPEAAAGQAGQDQVNRTAEAQTDVEPGLRIVDAIAGNPFGLRSGDVVVDICDRPGAETALEISAALVNDETSCVTLIRDGALVEVALDQQPATQAPSL